jgi:hypothetical protein
MTAEESSGDPRGFSEPKFSCRCPKADPTGRQMSLDMVINNGGEVLLDPGVLVHFERSCVRKHSTRQSDTIGQIWLTRSRTEKRNVLRLKIH